MVIQIALGIVLAVVILFALSLALSASLSILDGFGAIFSSRFWRKVKREWLG